MAYLSESKISEIMGRVGATPPSIRNGIQYLLQQVATAIATDGSKPAAKGFAVMRLAAGAKDGELVGIGVDVFEFDTDGVVGPGHNQVDLSAGSAIAAEGTLTVDTQPVSGNTMTIGEKVYTFVPVGTGTADGEIEIGADLTGAQANIVAAINGTDGVNEAHPLVEAAEFSGNDCILTALVPGADGMSIATTETFTASTNVFDDDALGVTTAGADATADQSATAFVASFNANNTEGLVAKKISANEVLIMSETGGIAELDVVYQTDTANSGFDTAAMRGGAASGQGKFLSLSRVPNANEVALGNLHVPLPFTPTSVFVDVRVTNTGARKAWDGAVKLTAGDDPYLTIDNSGSTDWAVTDTVRIVIIE